MSILVTGFDPFGGESINPAQQILESLEGRVHTCLLPTSYSRSVEVLESALERIRPRAVLSLGQAGGRATLSLERVAVNWMDAAAPDNDGVVHSGVRAVTDGPDGYLTTLDLSALRDALRREGVPAQVSLSAGCFVCNRVFYQARHWAAQHDPTMKVGFLHVPFLPRQVLDKPGVPSMELDTMLRGVNAILDEIRKG